MTQAQAQIRIRKRKTLNNINLTDFGLAISPTLFQEPEEVIIFEIHENNNVIGRAVVIYNDRIVLPYTCRKIKISYELLQFGIYQEYRGQGYGKQLLQAVKKYTQEPIYLLATGTSKEFYMMHNCYFLTCEDRGNIYEDCNANMIINVSNRAQGIKLSKELRDDQNEYSSDSSDFETDDQEENLEALWEWNFQSHQKCPECEMYDIHFECSYEEPKHMFGRSQEEDEEEPTADR